MKTFIKCCKSLYSFIPMFWHNRFSGTKWSMHYIILFVSHLLAGVANGCVLPIVIFIAVKFRVSFVKVELHTNHVLAACLSNTMVIIIHWLDTNYKDVETLPSRWSSPGDTLHLQKLLESFPLQVFCTFHIFQLVSANAHCHTRIRFYVSYQDTL